MLSPFLLQNSRVKTVTCIVSDLLPLCFLLSDEASASATVSLVLFSVDFFWMFFWDLCHSQSSPWQLMTCSACCPWLGLRVVAECGSQYSRGSRHICHRIIVDETSMIAFSFDSNSTRVLDLLWESHTIFQSTTGNKVEVAQRLASISSATHNCWALTRSTDWWPPYLYNVLEATELLHFSHLWVETSLLPPHLSIRLLH